MAWKPLVLCAGAEQGRQIGAALSAAGIAGAQIVAEHPPAGAIGGLAARCGANVCLVDVTAEQERALLLIAEAAGAMRVVAVHPQKDADLILRCLRWGACEFLSDLGAESIRSVFERLSRSRAAQPGRRTGTVYCVVPGKPGCGASTIALHLAFHMRRAGKVLLVDADPLFASIAFMLKLKSEFHLGDLVRDWKRMDGDLWPRLTVPTAGIDVLLAPETPAGHLELDPTTAAEIAAFWRERYDTTVVDAPDPRTAAESGFAAAADQVLVVTTNELASLHATARAIEFLSISIPERRPPRLVINRYTPALGLKRNDLKTVLREEPFAVLSNDYAMLQDALLSGKPAAPGSRFQSSLLALSERLQGKDPGEKSRGAWRSLLHLGHK